uniref:Corticostatin-related peptide RK-1 n=1 Tax=Oryctolagus cuniculus TaxID=9986 RepID=RK1_RABIT|nr:RecName: Full=Corticostatin-related peptide RK-1 [Oryctolagus cuniculus]AAB47094.1 RK-1=corticostatin/defensin-like peptide [rabbits, kidney, Peptide, 32 aa] [Oryctolagus cuniculus]1EWS_A Chain A, RK-1 DEFENSIN [Oryctolagus cuniculus]
MPCSCKKYCDPWEVIDGSCGLFNSKYICCREK